MLLTPQFLLTVALFSRLLGFASAAALSAREIHRRNAGIVQRNLEAGTTESVQLKPLDIDYLHHRLDRRSDVLPLLDYSRLDPSNSELLMYGAPTGDGGLFVANMTVMAPNGKKLLLMEKFQGFTRDVDCTTAGDGRLSVTLVSKRIFDYVQIWSWLNENDKNEFIMITNHKGCGPDAERVLYRVYQVEFDERELRVDFYSEQTEWNKAIGTYSVDFGSLDIVKPSNAPALHPRDLFVRSPFDFGKPFRDAGNGIKEGFENAGNAIADAFKDVGSWMKSLPADVSKQIEKLDDKMKEKLLSAAKKLKAAGKDFATVFNKAKDKLGDKLEEVAKAISDIGDGSLGKDNVDFDLSKGQPSRKKNLYTDPFHKKNPHDIIDCLDCYVTGKLVLSGRVQFEDFLPKSAYFEARPVDLTTMMKFRVYTLKSKDMNRDGVVDKGLTVEVDLFTLIFPVVMVPGIFLLGPKFEFEVAVKSLIKSDVEFTFGFKGQAPNTAVYRKDLLVKDKHESSKWEGAKMESLPFVLLNGSVEAEFQASTNLVLAIGIQLAGIFGYEAGFKLKLPRLVKNFSTITKTDSSPACPGSKHPTLANSTTGILERSDINCDLVALIGQDKLINAKRLETTLFNIKIPFKDECHPIVDNRTAEAKALAAWNNQLQGIPPPTFGTQTNVGVIKATINPIFGVKTPVSPVTLPGGGMPTPPPGPGTPLPAPLPPSAPAPAGNPSVVPPPPPPAQPGAVTDLTPAGPASPGQMVPGQPPDFPPPANAPAVDPATGQFPGANQYPGQPYTEPYSEPYSGQPYAGTGGSYAAPPAGSRPVDLQAYQYPPAEPQSYYPQPGGAPGYYGAQAGQLPGGPAGGY